ncbi:NRPS-like enzyme [Aspergillus ambiguus]|uniref:NRPS-like enzyme n=1 Tax=Aspergillus ambiguus TaxID=176160 RepID=UPI003CCD6FF4
MVDKAASDHPDVTYAEYPKFPWRYSEGYQAITYRDLANAVNGIAWWLTVTLGPGQNDEVLAYVGPNDLRYPALVLGVLKAGDYVSTSPRNSVMAQLSLLDKLRCTTLLSPAQRPTPDLDIINAQEFQILEVSETQNLLEPAYPAFPFNETLADAKSRPLFVLHTSGSTGIPKPITYTHETAARNMRIIGLTPPLGFHSQSRLLCGRTVFTFPPFHAASIASHFFYGVFLRAVLIAPISSTVPSAEGLVEGLKQTPADIAFIVPSLIEELANSPELLNFCAETLDAIMYCGGDLPQPLGDNVASRVRLLNQVGATELGFLPQIIPDSSYDLGAEFRHATDSQYELWVVREPSREGHQPTFSLPGFTHLSEYGSRDLYVRHPDHARQFMWRWVARRDDILVFVNGEKTNPVTMEQHILSRNPCINAALVVGAQRFQAALLVEPKGTASDDLLESIWPSIEEANKDCPAHARVFKTHVLFTNPDKPMVRAGKGTVQRAATCQLYKPKIDALYRATENIPMHIVPEGENISPSSIAGFVRKCVESITHWDGLNDDDNFFVKGMDSLQVMALSRSIRASLGIAGVVPSVIYASPSIADLIAAINTLREPRPDKGSERQLQSLSTGDETIQHYKGLIDRIYAPSLHCRAAKLKHHVLLTGSGGTLGSINAHSHRLQLGPPREESRVTYLAVNLSEERFQLPADIFDLLHQQSTLVIHSAWPVNFNIPLSSFKPQFDGILNLIKFCASAPHGPQLFFTSSISSVWNPHSPLKHIPEEILDVESQGLNGYAVSKYVTEHLLCHAARRFPRITFAVARVGQVAGPVRHGGQWNPKEWFPSLVGSSVHVCAIPDSLGSSLSRIDWVPVDMLSNVLVELALIADETHAHNGVMVFHPHNLHQRQWQSVRPVVVNAVFESTGSLLETVSLREWIARVEKELNAAREGDASTGSLQSHLKVNPGARLLEFYRALVASEEKDTTGNYFATSRTSSHSTLLSHIPALRDQWVQKWIKEWIEEM